MSSPAPRTDSSPVADDVHADATATVDATAVDVVEIGMDRVGVIRRLNEAIFDDAHVINTFARDGLLMLVAHVDGRPAGFKVGYALDDTGFYSAKGGVHPRFRRRGLARRLLHVMMDVARERGFERFVYDTFPNKHPGMTVLGLDEGFRVVKAGYSPQYKDYRLRFERSL